MDKAKAAIKDFTSKAGHHDTTVHEHAHPAVVNETITPTRQEEAQTVVDREVHQDHHHTTVQPISHREVLPEEHSHNLVGVEHKKYNHGDHAATQDRIQREAAQFKNTQTKGETRHTQSVAETVGGEHVHHHVHENIQPVVQKETIQPSVVHTTAPVHEVHTNAAKHHTTSALPAVSMADFKAQGGTLSGREDRIDRFDGEPRTETASQHAHHGGTHQHGLGGNTTTGSGMTGNNASSNASPHGTVGNKLDPRVDSDMDGSRTAGGTNQHGLGGNTTTGSGMTGNNASSNAGPHGTVGNKFDPHVDSDMDSSITAGGNHRRGLGNDNTYGNDSTYGSGMTGNNASSNAGPHGAVGNKLDPRVDSDMDGSRTAGHNTTTGGTNDGYTGRSNAASANQVGGMGSSTTGTGTTANTTGKKPSLMDKLNPKVDSNGDGKAGFMK